MENSEQKKKRIVSKRLNPFFFCFEMEKFFHYFFFLFHSDTDENTAPRLSIIEFARGARGKNRGME